MKVQPNQDLDEFVIHDFTGGIVSQGYNAQTGPKFSVNTSSIKRGSKIPPTNVPTNWGGLSPANRFLFIPVQDKVTANSLFTFGCIGLPTGGLAPMPLRTTAFTTPWSASFPTTDPSDTACIVGFYSNPIGDLYGPNQFTELIIVTEVADTANSTRYTAIASENNSSGSWSGNELFTNNQVPGGSLVNGFCLMRPFLTRMANITSVSTNWQTPGQPVIVMGWTCMEKTTQGWLIVYPDPTTPTVKSTRTISNSTHFGDAFGHQGRVVLLEHTQDSWPYGTLQHIANNDRVDVTAPPNSYNTAATTMGVQQEIFAEEFPYGYGCWGSINAGELLLIKNRGGGVVVSGDIFSPQVIFVPGIQDTGGWFGLGAVTPFGLVYCSGGGGAWVWQGGNQAQKISQALDDYFFQVSNLFNFTVTQWQNFLVFPNNYVFDTITSAWWLLVDNHSSINLPSYPSILTKTAYMQYTLDASEQVMYAAPVPFTVGNRSTTTIDQFSRAIGANIYQWLSQPILLADDRLIEIRELVLHVTGQPGSTVGVVIQKLDGTYYQHSFLIPSGGPFGSLTPYTARLACNVQ